MKYHHKKLIRKCFLVITCLMLIMTLTACGNASPDYEGKSVESSSFTVTVHEDGRYVLTVIGSEAKGNVKLTKPEQKSILLLNKIII